MLITLLCQVIYKAHGSCSSWEWLGMISPCIDILRKLATEINSTLGSCQGSKHSTPDLWKDIKTLMDSLEERRVYTIEHGRVITGKKASILNVTNVGLKNLAGPLRDYNTMF